MSKNTELDTLDCSGNKLSLELSDSGRFDLSALKGFDVSKASGWSEGAAVDGNILTVPYGVTEISYQYDLGNGKSGTFTLTFDAVKEPDLPDDSSAPRRHRQHRRRRHCRCGRGRRGRVGRL